MKYSNPIIRGMYPDPSMCASNGKYYLVCSSFNYFPGVPLFESEDLINWKRIGNCLTRKSQLLLDNASTGGGIYAPTIRYNNGRFYMVVTNVSNIGNFYVYTDDIYGEWSEPIKVEQDGIDPSLFFDTDGKVYFISNGNGKDGLGCVQMSEIDISNGKKLSENVPIWYGTGGRYIEAPHMYKFGDYYYILNAEGGTEYGHMVNYARSKKINGPFEDFPQNPVLSNRNLGGYQLQGAGHGDLLQAEDGTWWFCHLGFRQIDKWLPFHHLGRETCMESVIWKDGWFYIGTEIQKEFTKQGYGAALEEVEAPLNHKFSQQCFSYTKTFENLSLVNDWCFLQNPDYKNYKLEKNYFELKGTALTIEEDCSPTWIGVRQCEFEEDTECNVYIIADKNCSGENQTGLTIYMDVMHHYDIYLTAENNKIFACCSLKIGPVQKCIKKVEIKQKNCILKIKSTSMMYQFFVNNGESDVLLGEGSSRYLSSEVACGFTGVFIGLYTQGENISGKFENLKIIHK